VRTLPPGFIVLSREEILKAARALVGEVGADGMTMRALGDRLNVVQGGIYRHMSCRDEILDALIDQVFEEIEFPGPDVGDWSKRLYIGTLRIYDAFAALPGLSIHLLQRPNHSTSAPRVREWVEEILVEGGLTPDEVVRVRRVFSVMSIGGHGLDSSGAALNLRRGSDTTPEEFRAAVANARSLYSDALGYVIDGLRAEVRARHA
jgi:AcrR family transcriptional regulator